MDQLTPEELDFYKKINSSEIKKISLNLSKETLEKIDELSSIFKITRTLIIESIMRIGIKPYLEIIESANKKLKKEYPENKELDLMLEKLQKFRTKWRIK